MYYLRNAVCLKQRKKLFVNFKYGKHSVYVDFVLLGLLWQEVKQVYGDGYSQHFSSLYNVIDFLMLMLYTASFTLRYMVFIKVS